MKPQAYGVCCQRERSAIRLPVARRSAGPVLVARALAGAPIELLLCDDSHRRRALRSGDGILASAAARLVCGDQVSVDHSAHVFWQCVAECDAGAVAGTEY